MPRLKATVFKLLLLLGALFAPPPVMAAADKLVDVTPADFATQSSE